MNFKKFALRGLIILAAAVALCLLFSGTIRTLTTPKVRYAPVKSGKFENVTELTGKVVFPEKEELTLEIPEGMSLTVTRVYAEPGKRVREGEKLFTAAVTDMDKTLSSLQQEIDTERESLDAWERKNGAIRLSRNEQRWADAFYAAREAEKTERTARLDLLSRLEPFGLTAVPDALPEGADEALGEAFAAWQQADTALAAARADLTALDRFAVADDVWSLLKQKQESEQKLADAEDRMMQILLLSRRAETICAPHDGYVIDVNAEKDTVLSGSLVLLTLTPENQQPVIRSELPDLKVTVQKGTVLTIPSDSWGYAETRVISTGMTSSGRPFIDAEINDDVIYTLGEVSAILKDEIKLRLTTRSKESTCLLPASAVRGSGDARYVFVGQTESSALAGSRITVQKVTVTVLAESATTVSVAEDLSWSKVLYMEDRAIDEGTAVMLYEE